MGHGRLWVLLLFFGNLSHASLDPQEKIRVKLFEFKDSISISGLKMRLPGISSQYLKKVKANEHDQVQIEPKRVLEKPIWLVKQGDQMQRISQPYLEVFSSDSKLLVNGQSVDGPVLLWPRNDQTVDVIAALDFDEYLTGVVMGEMPSDWPDEALKAQAVTARTYALYQMMKRKTWAHQVEGNQNDQVFIYPKGQRSYAKISAIIQETKNWLLLKDGLPIKAFFHADCGGQTEEAHYVWGDSQTLSNYGTTKLQGCPYMKSKPWDLRVTLKDLQNSLRSIVGSEKIRTIEIVSRSPSMRALNVRITSATQSYLIPSHEFRKLVGYNKVRSTLFSIDQSQDAVMIRGRGYGHGSGLCQWGARTLAQQGFKAQDILKLYYPRATLNITNIASK